MNPTRRCVVNLMPNCHQICPHLKFPFSWLRPSPAACRLFITGEAVIRRNQLTKCRQFCPLFRPRLLPSPLVHILIHHPYTPPLYTSLYTTLIHILIHHPYTHPYTPPLYTSLYTSSCTTHVRRHVIALDQSCSVILFVASPVPCGLPAFHIKHTSCQLSPSQQGGDPYTVYFSSCNLPFPNLT